MARIQLFISASFAAAWAVVWKGKQEHCADNGGKDGLFHSTTHSTDSTSAADKWVLRQGNARHMP
jgi:hypothetical protein